MKVLGLDPGLAAVGYAVLWLGETPDDLELVEYDTFETPKDTPERERLAAIRRWLTILLSSRQPEVVAVERPYPMPKMGANIVPVSAAFGVIVEAVAAAGVRRVTEHRPPDVKAAVGLGRFGSKADVRAAVCARFATRFRGRDDGLDAIAVALAHVKQLERDADHVEAVRRGGGLDA